MCSSDLADERLHGDRMRKAWFGVLALLAMAFLGGLILSLSLLHEAQRPASLGGEAAAKERSE